MTHHNDRRSRQGASAAQELASASPPPRLATQPWLRYLLLLSQAAGIAAVLQREYEQAGAMMVSIVVIPHVVAAILLVAWSIFAMLDAARLVPATRYVGTPRASVVVVLWLAAFAAPVAAYRVLEQVRDRFAERTDDLAVIAATVGAIVICFFIVWLPFRYHIRQAHRIGVRGRVVAEWFWLPLFSLVGVLAVMALGLREVLMEDGTTDLERVAQVAVVYGVPALIFALSTWRVTSAFDNVIELRWIRWRSEWDQAMAARGSSAQPPASRP